MLTMFLAALVCIVFGFVAIEFIMHYVDKRDMEKIKNDRRDYE